MFKFREEELVEIVNVKDFEGVRLHIVDIVAEKDRYMYLLAPRKKEICNYQILMFEEKHLRKISI